MTRRPISINHFFPVYRQPRKQCIKLTNSKALFKQKRIHKRFRHFFLFSKFQLHGTQSTASSLQQHRREAMNDNLITIDHRLCATVTTLLLLERRRRPLSRATNDAVPSRSRPQRQPCRLPPTYRSIGSIPDAARNPLGGRTLSSHLAPSHQSINCCLIVCSQPCESPHIAKVD